MKKMMKHIAATALAVVMAVNVGAASASAVAPLENGSYEANIHFYKENTTEFTSDNYSMCDALFVHKAEVTLTDNEVQIDAYVAYPVPAFSSMGQEGTLKNMRITHNGTQYTAVSDIDSKTVKTFDTANTMFGIKSGDKLPTQKLTIKLPRDAVNALDKGFATTAFVNVFMNMDVNFIVRLADLTSTPVAPTEESKKSMTVTAEVAAPVAAYTVTIPESVTLGTLSAEKDTIYNFSVEVKAANMGDGYVEVSTEGNGNLTSGENTLPFVNSFGTQKTSADATLTGNFTVSADAVKTAAAGNYTGTANFSIRYFAGK